MSNSICPLLRIKSCGEVVIHDELLNPINDTGYNRSTSQLKLMKAETDSEALLTFLNEYQDSPKTLLLYAKEIERLLLWCLHVHQLSLTELTREHITEYQNFLIDPQPVTLWCGKKVSRYKKDDSINSDWKPFFKGLTDASIKKAFKILDSFFNYLVEMHYLQGNPIAMNRRRKKRNATKPRLVERYLEIDELIAVLNALEAYPQSNSQDKFRIVRARYIILLLFYSGMRIAESANHTMGNFIQRDHCWFLSIVGKGKKPRDIPVPDELLAALASFRKSIGLPSSEPTFKETTPLIPSVNLKHTLRVRRIDQIVKWAFNLGAMAIESKYPHKASKLRQASAHWLRHSYVTYLLDSGASLKVAQENAGHSNISTTMLYRHVSQTNRHSATRNLSIGQHETIPIEKKPDNHSPAIEKNLILKANDSTEKLITLKMHFCVENNSKFVRGKNRSLREIEDNIFSEYNLKVIDRECGEYEITLTYTSLKDLDDQLEEIASEAEFIADSRNGFTEFDVYTFDGEHSWPFSD